ncbi:hypothetical protein GPJ56_000109 [Histomonas meleagridis]|uniref:uncharacterized protein n=1 Tax=Histomonas meleagridis TaxID=135588 RepID=UPI00355A7F1F|nr:hypothetical protein GPJ56_000109 [Histomonas meleagridis]KAH0805608.1 hypothetical protein GO595_001663 [Histomonas meleagridis]
MSKLNEIKRIPDDEIPLNCFVYDQVPLFIYRGAVSQNLNTSALVALLASIDAKNQPPKDLLQILTNTIINEEMINMDKALVCSGMDFICKQKELPNVDSNVIIQLIRGEFPPQVTADLIRLLKASKASELQIGSLFDLFLNFVYNLSEEMTPIHIALAEVLPMLLFDKKKGIMIAYRLLIDDVPRVRTLTMKALSDMLKIPFASEIRLIEILNERIAQNDPSTLCQIIFKWLNLMQKKTENDTHGEPLTILVDEFYVVREGMKSLGHEVPFDNFTRDGLLDARRVFIESSLKIFEEKVHINK